jgi:uncharacterized membrane protein YfhO
LFLTFVVLLIALYYPYNFLQQYNILNTHLRNVATLFLSSYTVLLFFLRNSKKHLPLQLLILTLVCLEMVSFSRLNVNERHALTNVEYKQKTGYSDYTIDAIAYLNRIDKGFFRVAKNYHSGPAVHASLNDAKVQQYRGTASYHSFNQRHYVNFLAGMNIINENDEKQTRWLTGFRNMPFLHSFASVKYYLSKDPKPFIHVNYELLTTVGDVKIYKNKLALPLGFTYNRFISRKAFNSLSPQQKRVAIYNDFILNDSIYKNYSKYLPTFERSDTSKIYPLQEYVNDIYSLKNDTLAISKFNSNNIKGTITLEEKKMLFFSIPYSEGWSALVDGRKQSLLRINIGFIGLPLEKGEHTVELSFTPPLFNIGAVVSAISISLYLFLLILYQRRKRVHPAVS